MRCPECGQMLEPLQEQAYSALVCRGCGGMFYPETEFNKHLDLGQGLLPPQITRRGLDRINRILFGPGNPVHLV